MEEYIKVALEDAQSTLGQFLNSSKNIQDINNSVKIMTESLKNGGKLLSCGNGGSMCDSMHFVEELTGRFRKDRPPIAAISMSDASHITCVANDYGFDYVFSRNVEAWGKKGDVLLAISTSGNSKNIIEATKSAKQLGMQIVALLGKTGGEMKNLADISIIVPSDISDRIQEIHIKTIHIFIECIERTLYPEHYS